jgi:hypothetical protein
MKQNLCNFWILSILSIMLLANYGCRRKPVNPINKVVNIQFISNAGNQGPCAVSNAFFNNMRVVMDIGTLDANNDIEWLIDKYMKEMMRFHVVIILSVSH